MNYFADPLPVGQVSEAVGKVSLPVVACRADLR